MTGAHTHYLAADSDSEAKLWMRHIRDAWHMCFAHTARRTGGSPPLAPSAAQRLVSENLMLRTSLAEVSAQAHSAKTEAWKCVFSCCSF